MITGIPGSACTPPRPSTSAPPTRSASSAASCSPGPTVRTPSGSSTAPRNPRNCPTPSGSTRPPRHRQGGDRRAPGPPNPIIQLSTCLKDLDRFRLVEAEAAFGRAGELLAGVGSPFEWALVELAYGQVLRRVGQRRAAAERLSGRGSGWRGCGRGRMWIVVSSSWRRVGWRRLSAASSIRRG